MKKINYIISKINMFQLPCNGGISIIFVHLSPLYKKTSILMIEMSTSKLPQMSSVLWRRHIWSTKRRLWIVSTRKLIGHIYSTNGGGLSTSRPCGSWLPLIPNRRRWPPPASYTSSETPYGSSLPAVVPPRPAHSELSYQHFLRAWPPYSP